MELPRVRNGAYPACSAVPKSQELGSPFERRGVRSTPKMRGGASPAYSALPKSRELSAPHLLKENTRQAYFAHF